MNAQHIKKVKVANSFPGFGFFAIAGICEELDSKRFWEKWNRVGEKDIEKIALLFFKRIAGIERPTTGCFLFNTINYYTYMDSKIESELAARGKNNEGKDWLRQME